MKTVGVFLDDERNPEDVIWIQYPDNIEWKVVRTMREFVAWCVLVDKDVIQNAVFSFDHDLQDFDHSSSVEYTGYTCIKWLVDYLIYSDFKLPDSVYFHSQNPIGRDNMQTYYENARKFQCLK